MENNQATKWFFIYSQDHFAGRTSTNDLKRQRWVLGLHGFRRNLDLGIQKRQGGGYISINRPILERESLSSYGSSVLAIGGSV